MANIILDFERPIAELEAQSESIREHAAANNINVDEEIASLNRRIDEKKRDIFSKLTPWQKVQLARHPNRPYTLDHVGRIFTDFIQLCGDRRYAEDAAVVGGFAKLNDEPVMVIGTQKGRDVKQNALRNFGCPHPEGYRKALRLMELGEKAKVPIISFIDTSGAYPGIASEERHIGEAIAVNLRESFKFTVPFLAIVIGEGGSGGALGIGVGNRILIMEHAYYSVITPEGCAAILWKDRAFAPKASEALKLTSGDLKELGIVDEVVEEPLGGAHNDYDLASDFLKKSIVKNLKQLSRMSCDKLVEQRYEKYRAMGKFVMK